MIRWPKAGMEKQNTRTYMVINLQPETIISKQTVVNYLAEINYTHN